MKRESKLKKLVLVFFIVNSLLFNVQGQQTTFQVNNRTIYKTDSLYYIQTSHGQVFLETQRLTVKFQTGQEVAGIELLEANYGLQFEAVTSGVYHIFKVVNNSNPYPLIIQDINGLSGVQKTFISFVGQYFDSKPFPNDPGNPSQNVFINSSSAWWVGGDTGPGLEEYEYLNLLGAWGYTTGNNSIRVGIIDCGLDWGYGDDLPPYRSNDITGRNFLTGTDNTYPDYSQGIDNSHGTSVASVLCGRTNNGPTLGVFGVAGGWSNPDEGFGISPVMAVNGRIILGYNQNGPILGWSTAVTPECIAWITDPQAGNCKVVNMSFGISGLSNDEIEPIKAAIDEAIAEHDAIFVAAAGNYGSQTPSASQNHDVYFPANYEPVISIGGVGEDHEIWATMLGTNVTLGSCYGPELDFVTSMEAYHNAGSAPLTSPIIRIGRVPATSFSTPMISGVIGLMLSVNPCLTSYEILEILKASCYKTTNYSTWSNGRCNEVGYGFVNAKKAVELSIGLDAVLIQGNKIWSHNRSQNGNITIPAGGKLTLEDMTLRMTGSSKIIVGVGGELEIINSTITSACGSDEFWQGIVVDGSPSLAQVPFSNQGRVVMSNSTISNALIGIEAWVALDGQQSTGHGGGIVQAAYSTFINNNMAVSFGPYQNISNSQFVDCDFLVDDGYFDLDESFEDDQILVKLDGMNRIQFKGCRFSNQFNDAENRFKGIGLRALSSNFMIDGLCTADPVVEPCPENEYQFSIFSWLKDGVKASGNGTLSRLKVERTQFTDNNCGLHFIEVDFAAILRNFFQIFAGQEPVDPCGAYLDECSGYHIELNTFTSFPQFIDESGLYIRNSGPAQNYVYNNRFSFINRGIVADKYNRSDGGSTGLSFKCNDFEHCTIDIDIQRDPLSELSPFDGVALNIGSPLIASAQIDTLPAGNIFTEQTAAYNMHNIANPSYYFFHEQTNPYGLKVKPEPVTEETVFREPVDGTTYNRDYICQSWITTTNPPIENMIYEREQARQEALSLDAELAQIIDEGNTEELAADVIYSTPQEALDLKQELEAQSPYLSDSVLKTAVENEYAFINSMIRDILVENPQAAKSEAIMQLIDERVDPMPGYMKEEIEEGKEIVGAKEKLIAERDAWLQKESHYFNRIVSAYYDDYGNPSSLNDLKTFLSIQQEPQALLHLVEMYIREKSFTLAMNTLDVVSGLPGLNPTVQAQVQGYNSLINILISMSEDSIPWNNIDSVHATLLFDICDLACPEVSSFAGNLLAASGLFEFGRVFNYTEVVKSAFWGNQEGSDQNCFDESAAYRIYPNPADYYLILEYNDPGENKTLIVTDSFGRKVLEKQMFELQDQLILDIHTFPLGSYTISVISNKKVIYNTPFIIAR